MSLRILESTFSATSDWDAEMFPNSLCHQASHLEQVFTSWEPYHDMIHHHKYCNNYDYQKSIMLVGRIPFFDGTYVMLQETEKLVSPISVLYYRVL